MTSQHQMTVAPPSPAPPPAERRLIPKSMSWLLLILILVISNIWYSSKDLLPIIAELTGREDNNSSSVSAAANHSVVINPKGKELMQQPGVAVNNSSTPAEAEAEEKFQPTKKNAYNSPTEGGEEKKREKQQEDNETDNMHYHDYAIFIVMYHKTGYVLTRQLKRVVSMLEIETHRPDEKDIYFSKINHTNYGTDVKTGERFAFDTIGNWARSAFVPRRHSFDTHCPKGYRNEPFQIQKGKLYVQESPDLFCDVKELKRAILARKAKIIHFVRNPVSCGLVLHFNFLHSCLL